MTAGKATSGQVARAPVDIELCLRWIDLATACLIFGLEERRIRDLSKLDAALAKLRVVVCIATDPDGLVLATAVSRTRDAEAAVRALDGALAAMSRAHDGRPAVRWKLVDRRVVIRTDQGFPFTTSRFLAAVRELGCQHRFRVV